jgi:TonB family protein
MNSAVDSGPNLLMDWHESTGSRRWLRAGIGSAVVHVLLVTGAILLAQLDTPDLRTGAQIVSNFQRVTPLIAPPTRLTQKEPNQGKVSKEVSVESLLSHSQKAAPQRPAMRAFKPPQARPVPSEPSAPRMAEPPKVDTRTTAANAPPLVGPSITAPAPPPPPQIQPEEKPKLALETPGQHAPVTSPNLAKLPPVQTTVDDAIRGLARSDMEQPPNLGNMQLAPPAVNLLSDPMNVDFRPYLARILALVRRNWLTVIPASARLGNRGMVTVQFIVDRTGQVPKLVIETPSGSEALDRAAVAGISASVPFPPLPAEFKGSEIRLQFAFKYNIK